MYFFQAISIILIIQCTCCKRILSRTSLRAFRIMFQLRTRTFQLFWVQFWNIRLTGANVSGTLQTQKCTRCTTAQHEYGAHVQCAGNYCWYQQKDNKFEKLVKTMIQNENVFTTVVKISYCLTFFTYCTCTLTAYFDKNPIRLQFGELDGPRQNHGYVCTVCCSSFQVPRYSLWL